MSKVVHIYPRNTSRSRAFCYTFNNFSLGWEFGFALLETDYHIYGREIAPTTGTPHIQGYLHFPNARVFSSLLKRLPPGIHLEIAKGSPDQNIAYCSKSGDFVETGVRPVSKKRQGELGAQVYSDAIVSAKQGKFEDIPSGLYTRHFATYHKMFSLAQVIPLSMDILDFHWYWGPTGTGKTRKARDENPGAYLKNPNKWWDGYVGQTCVIIDEWSPCHSVLASHLKQWADHHAFAAEIKGGSKCLRPVKLIVTSNYSIQECFPDPSDHLPLLRRFQVTHFDDMFSK